MYIVASTFVLVSSIVN